MKIAHIVLDTGVLGLLTHPSRKPEPVACKDWLRTLAAEGRFIHIPEIADYELRRELLRLGLSRAVARLVVAERDGLAKLVRDINQTVAVVAPEKGIQLELVRWETHAVPAAGRPQGVINSQIGDYDIFVGVMWRRFGMPTTEAGSGTEEEFDRAYAEFQRCGRPHIMFYFCQAPAPPPKPGDELTQLNHVVAFRDKLSKRALVWEYEKHEDFVDTVRPHLLGAVTRLISGGHYHPTAGLAPDSSGLADLRRQLTEYATEYARIRKALPAGDQRTRQLELIATKIRTSALAGMPVLEEFARGATPGERLVAAVFLQVAPRSDHLTWLAQRLSELQPFVGYHAAVALLAAARTLDCSHASSIDAAIGLGLKRLGPKPGTDRHRTLRIAKKELKSRCSVDSQ